MSLENPILKTFKINNEQLEDEINYLMEIKKDYMIYKKNSWNDIKKKKKVKPYVLEINDIFGGADTNQISITDLEIQEKKDREADYFIIIVKKDKKLLYEKKIVFSKTINILDSIKNITQQIQNNNIINKIKNLIDKIKGIDFIDINDITNSGQENQNLLTLILIN